MGDDQSNVSGLAELDICNGHLDPLLRVTARGPPDEDGEPLRVIGDAVRRGRDQVIADDLATLVDVPVANRHQPGAVRFMEDDTTVLALGDAGAHVMSVTNYRYPSFMLAELVQKRGLLDLSLVVNRITQQPALIVKYWPAYTRIPRTK